MFVGQISFSDSRGGAARAAYRIHSALRQHGVTSIMKVGEESLGDSTVEGPKDRASRLTLKLRSSFAAEIMRLLHTSNCKLHSPAILPSRWPTRLNNSHFDVINLHWINAEMMSVADIAKITKPIVWTLHDMWAFCGAEHSTDTDRWINGYTSKKRPIFETGFDLNRWTWLRKAKHWKRPMQIVAPSRWLADCVRRSALMRDWPVRVIGNAIDTNSWLPVEKALARRILNLPADVPLVLFGAIGGTQDQSKGFEALRKALDHLRGQIPEMQLIVFGQLAPSEPINVGFPIRYFGHLHDDLSLRILYSAVDVIVSPSTFEAFGQTLSEAHACGTAAVGNASFGHSDIIDHKRTGYLVKNADTIDLAAGLLWVLQDSVRLVKLGQNAREKATRTWSYHTIAREYMNVYEQAIQDHPV